MVVPMTVAIIVQKLIFKEPLKEPLGISWRINRWWLVAWFLPLVIAFATLGVSLLLPGVGYSPDMAGIAERFKSMLPPEQFEKIQKQMVDFPIRPFWLGLVQGLIAGISVNALAGFGEELGWRGLLQRELGFIGFWKSSILIGAIWGIWHAPLILKGHNYPQHPVIGVFLMTGWCMLLAPIFSYVRLKAKSVIAAAIIHGSLNATYGLAIVFVRGSDLLVGVSGLAGFIVLAVVNICIFIYEQFIVKN
jgi:membrane protease YdiL (CAAX protease family)